MLTVIDPRSGTRSLAPALRSLRSLRLVGVLARSPAALRCRVAHYARSSLPVRAAWLASRLAPGPLRSRSLRSLAPRSPGGCAGCRAFVLFPSLRSRFRIRQSLRAPLALWSRCSQAARRLPARSLRSFDEGRPVVRPSDRMRCSRLPACLQWRAGGPSGFHRSARAPMGGGPLPPLRGSRYAALPLSWKAAPADWHRTTVLSRRGEKCHPSPTRLSGGKLLPLDYSTT